MRLSREIVHQGTQEQRRRYKPDSYQFIQRRVLPRLIELGTDPEAVRVINVVTPRRFFEGG